MRIQVEGKAFVLELKDGFLKINESYRNCKRWINFPVKLIGWVSKVLNCCSDLVEFEYSRRFGFLWWKIQSGCNRWGWFLKLSVVINGSIFSVFVPAKSGGNPWIHFVNAFLHVAGKELKQPDVVCDVVVCDAVVCDAVVCNVSQQQEADFLAMVDFNLNHESQCSELKLQVDAMLELENQVFASTVVASGCKFQHCKEKIDSNCCVQSEQLKDGNYNQEFNIL